MAPTFAVYALQLSQGRPVRLAHHWHARAQLIEAAHRKIPALLVIRRPEEAILSHSAHPGAQRDAPGRAHRLLALLRVPTPLSAQLRGWRVRAGDPRRGLEARSRRSSSTSTSWTRGTSGTRRTRGSPPSTGRAPRRRFASNGCNNLPWPSFGSERSSSIRRTSTEHEDLVSTEAPYPCHPDNLTWSPPASTHHAHESLCRARPLRDLFSLRIAPPATDRRYQVSRTCCSRGSEQFSR